MTPETLDIQCEQQHPTLSVKDLAAAADFYTTKLGFTRGFSWGEPPAMVGVNLGDVSIHLIAGTPSPAGCSVYFVVGDADALYELQRENGVEIVEPPGDKPWGLRDYRVRDLDGYELGFGHRLRAAGPPLEIERVALPVRLEKRLAALLEELAEHKQMSLSGCLEEIVLHSFEPVAGGTASPHSKRTFKHIRELKAKHRIEYDAHASYRFVER